MVNDKAWKPSNVVGHILIFLGLVPFVLWTLDYIDVIRPDKEPAHWFLILFAVAALGLGVTLRTGKGSSIADAFFSWFKKGHSHDG